MTLRHDEAMSILHFAGLEREAIADFEKARERRDAPAMAEAATRWERAENQISN
jgi:hypothetical protein